MEIRKVGVLGCGLMGSGIAQTAASAGFETVVREMSIDLIDKGFAGIEKSLAKFAEKGTITIDQKEEIRARLTGTTNLEDLADCDIIVEAIIENLDLKRDQGTGRGLQAGDIHASHLFDRSRDDDGPRLNASSASSACTSSIPCRS